MALDLVEQFRCDARVTCVVCTDDAGVANEARALGAEVWWTGESGEKSNGLAETQNGAAGMQDGTVEPDSFGNPRVDAGRGQRFDWLRTLQEVVRAFAADPDESVVVAGGCGAPFLTREGVREMAERQRDGVWQNNRMSPDIVWVKPASAVLQVRECLTDNHFGFALEEQAGLPVQFFPGEMGLFYDVDTPFDALLAAKHPAAGERLRAAAGKLPQGVALEEMLAVLARTDYPDIALLGRVHPLEAEAFGQALGLRMRVFSEERGMKALGREEKGLVRSLTAALVETIGVEAFFSELAGMASGVLWDTRVLFAHLKLQLSEQERFAADLGLVEEVHDPFLRSFTEAAVRAPIPVLTGGQALVSGALRLLREATKR
ncbi:hypothetical protein EL26_19380 [Tumebacillus flagellatus]|uniref:Uncharacterized protein n=2 Tax=Tumebacillus flagellatus TaxID=1157490 RepID=A0A074LMN3_9BACL|nr:hypothetical protein EL26_19380 [Tumebacillus flagellatus]